MEQPPYTLAQDSRVAVLEALEQARVYRGWSLLAAHVRSDHLHAVVEAEGWSGAINAVESAGHSMEASGRWGSPVLAEHRQEPALDPHVIGRDDDGLHLGIGGLQPDVAVGLPV